jgi:hypothetical protein
VVAVGLRWLATAEEHAYVESIKFGYLGIELQTALARVLRVIPSLVESANVPLAKDLGTLAAGSNTDRAPTSCDLPTSFRR